MPSCYPPLRSGAAGWRFGEGVNMRCTRLHVAFLIVGLLSLASSSNGFVVAGSSSKLRLRHPLRAANSVTVSSENHGRATLRMGAAGKKRKKVSRTAPLPSLLVMCEWEQCCHVCSLTVFITPPCVQCMLHRLVPGKLLWDSSSAFQLSTNERTLCSFKISRALESTTPPAWVRVGFTVAAF